MKDAFETIFSRNLSAICLIAAPTFFVISDLVSLISTDFYYISYIFGKAGTAMFVFAIFVLVQMLRPQMEKLAIISGGMTIIGAISGSTLVSFVYFAEEMSKSGIDAGTMQTLETLFRQVYITMVFMPLPGLFFPLGLTILSLGLFLKKTVPRPITVILALGAISFPFGRIPGNVTVFVVTDFLFTVSLGFIGWQILSSSFALKQKLNYSEV